MTNMLLARLLALGIVSSLALCAADPVIGTWVLDVKKSAYKPGPTPRSQTRVYRESSEGITATVVTMASNGKITTVEYPVNYDGHPHAVSGSPDIDIIKMTKVDTRRSASILEHAGRVIATTTREVSGDARALTIIYEGKTADGESIRNVSYYARQ